MAQRMDLDSKAEVAHRELEKAHGCELVCLDCEGWRVASLGRNPRCRVPERQNSAYGVQRAVCELEMYDRSLDTGTTLREISRTSSSPDTYWLGIIYCTSNN
jgi:hypothetical protein